MAQLRRVGGLGIVAAALGAALASGCAGGPAEDDGGPSPDRAVAAVEASETSPRADVPKPVDPVEFERTLAAAGRRADEFVALAGDAGPEGGPRRALARSTLEAFAAEHVDRLLAGATDTGDASRRRTCLKALAFSNDRRATAAAVDALGAADDPALQTVAGFALAVLADPDTPTDALLEAVRSLDLDVRVNALVALRSVLDARGLVANFIDQEGRDSVLAVLETVMFDPADPTVRGNAVSAAAAVGDPRIVPSLVNLLRDTDPFVRRHTAVALGRFGRRPEVRPLVEVIDSTPEGPARTAVVGAVARILEREGIEAPAGLPDESAPWQAFADRSFAEQDRRPVR